MATMSRCLASLARLSLSSGARPVSTSVPPFLHPSIAHTQQTRLYAAQNRNQRAGGKRKKPEKKRKTYKTYRSYDLRDVEQFSLCDAIRYCRAFEVGRAPASVKYAVAVKLKTNKSGPVVRSRLRMPHPVKSDMRIGVIAPEGSQAAADARLAGAVLVGEESLFESVRAGVIPFNRLICHSDSMPVLQKAALGRLLGPKGLMPSPKTKTVTGDVVHLMKEMAGAENFRERTGVLRLAVGQLGFSPEMVAANIKAIMKHVKGELVEMEDVANKQVEEVVLSSTNSPGFSLNGSFNSTDDTITPAHLTTVM